MAENNNDSILSDAFSSTKELITDRFSSPFIFSFVISWILINFKTILILLTDVTKEFNIYEKLVLTDQIIRLSILDLHLNGYFLYLNGFIYPLGIAILYTFVYPYVDLFITTYTLKQKVKIRNVRVDAEKNIYHTQKDVEKKLEKYIRIEKDLNDQIIRGEQIEFRLRKYIDVLESQVKINSEVQQKKDELESQLKEIQENYEKSKKEAVIINNLKDSLNKGFGQVEIDKLKVVEKNAIKFIGSYLTNNHVNQIDSVALPFNAEVLENLEKVNILIRHNQNDGDRAYSLSTQGRKIHKLLTNSI